MSVAILRGDARSLPLPDASVDLIVTSPPYFGLRSYTDNGQHYEGQIGSEATPAEFLAALVACTREWTRVLKPSGSLFVNLGDKYGGQPPGPQGSSSATSGRGWDRTRAAYEGTRPKSLLGLPWRYAIACMDELGLILRAEVVWSKPNGLPESVTDRVRRAHEQVFHFTLRPRYYAAVDEIREPHASTKPGSGGLVNGSYASMRGDGALGRSLASVNPLGKLPGSVWEIPSAPLTVPASLGVDHFAAFPPALVRPVVLGWSPPGICVECGEGRRPVTAYTGERGRQPGGGGTYRALRAAGEKDTNLADAALRPRTITGYACACPEPSAHTRPAVVLDPFGGTGTTALVASVHGRHGVSVDMSADYCRLAAWRTSDPGERARALGVPKPPPVPGGMEPLFELGEAAVR